MNEDRSEQWRAAKVAAVGLIGVGILILSLMIYWGVWRA